MKSLIRQLRTRIRWYREDKDDGVPKPWKDPGDMPDDFPNADDVDIATIELLQTNSMAAALRAVAEWRRQR